MSLPEKPAYPSRYNALQTGWLMANVALIGLGLIAQQWWQVAYLVNALAAFYIARMGLENPKPKEEKKP